MYENFNTKYKYMHFLFKYYGNILLCGTFRF
jgi:hypothetical protein